MAKQKNGFEKTVKRSVKKTAKSNKGLVAIIIIAFVLFAAGGVFAAYKLTENDGLTLNDPNKSITVDIGGSYTEQGANFTVFGKDASSLVKIEIYDNDGELVDSIDSSESATYDVVYSIKADEATDFFVKTFVKKYKNYKQVRNVIVGTGD